MQTHARPAPPRSPIDGDRRPLRRTTDDRVWVGVAGGLAERFRVDAVVVRVGFVLAAAVWGAGVAIYCVLWFVVPEVDSPSRNIVRPGSRPTRFRAFALAAIVGGTLWVLRGWGALPDDRVLVPWLSICIGVVLLWGREPVRPLPRPALMPGPPNTLLTDVDFEPDPPPAPSEPPPRSHTVDPPQPDAENDPLAPPPRRGSTPALVPIGTLTAGSLLVVCGMLYLADDAGLVDVSWRLVGGVSLTVIGLSLIAGGWWGRPRGLIIAGSVLSLALLVATVLQVPVTGGVGRRDLRPASIETVAAEYRLGMGTFVLDLSDVELTADRQVTVSVAVGELRVIVPVGVDVRVDARSGFGEVVVFDRAGNGVGVRRTFDSTAAPTGDSSVDSIGAPIDQGPGLWILDLDVGVGKLLVEQVR